MLSFLKPTKNPHTIILQGMPQSKVSEMQILQNKDEMELDKLPSASNQGYLKTGNEEEDNFLINEDSIEQQKECLDVANSEEV